MFVYEDNDELHFSNITKPRIDVEDGSMDLHIEQAVHRIDTPHTMGSANIQIYQKNANTLMEDNPVAINNYANSLGTAADEAPDLATLTHEQ